jgi:hypothetical protein
MPAPDALPEDEEGSRWETVKAIRAARPGWVVIWVHQLDRFRAYADFPVRGPQRSVTGQDRAELEAEMDRIETGSRT